MIPSLFWTKFHSRGRRLVPAGAASRLHIKVRRNARIDSPGNLFLGAIIIGMLNNSLNLMNVSSYYQTIIKGVVILIAVLLDAKSKDR